MPAFKYTPTLIVIANTKAEADIYAHEHHPWSTEIESGQTHVKIEELENPDASERVVTLEPKEEKGEK